MDDIYVLSDTAILNRISSRLKEERLRQNMTRQELAIRSSVSVSSISRMEEGEIRSFDSLLRVLRILGRLEVLLPLVQESEPSPAEYYRMMQENKSGGRRRASRRCKSEDDKREEESQW
ncbi:MAG: helix-turn-helix domain-containing protein [Bacteroidales bacterium]|nr:helix-turn-helix domain-containing protein [Candidatus Cacconaster caballi]